MDSSRRRHPYSVTAHAAALKLNLADGSIVCQGMLAGAREDYSVDLEVTDSGVTVFGSTKTTQSGFADLYLAQFNAACELTMIRTYGGAQAEVAKAFAKTGSVSMGFAMAAGTNGWGSPGALYSFVMAVGTDGAFAPGCAPAGDGMGVDASARLSFGALDFTATPEVYTSMSTMLNGAAMTLIAGTGSSVVTNVCTP